MSISNESSKMYRDFSQFTEEEFLIANAKANEAKIERSEKQSREGMNSTKRRSTETEPCSRSNSNFPVKLHYMLEEVERDGHAHIISWQPHGRCFIVHKPKEFEEKLLPFWFKQSKFSSFQRQLNIYGFQRITTGHDKNGYYHEFFLRSKGFLSRSIVRHKFKGTGPRKASEPEKEPNLYLYPILPGSKEASSGDVHLQAPSRLNNWRQQQEEQRVFNGTQNAPLYIASAVLQQNSVGADTAALQSLLQARQQLMVLEQNRNNMLLDAIRCQSMPNLNNPLDALSSLRLAMNQYPLRRFTLPLATSSMVTGSNPQPLQLNSTNLSLARISELDPETRSRILNAVRASIE